MATADPVDFTRLAEAISDGDVVDWAAADSHASADDRKVLDALKVVSAIAGLHRTMPPAPGERPAELLAGDVWSHLTLREVIGRGAYGVVYRAWDPQLDREVALKLISEKAQRDHATVVVDEGRLLAKVRHRGVVTVYGAARSSGFAGLWMELVQGATFEEIIQQQGRFSAREAALFGAEVCEALAAVHSAGLLHRDVKAQNVMRDRSGRVVLMDFGTGRLRELADEAAVADLAGTPLYMAPELFSGGAASTRSDVYSVGVLLFRLVTGSFPLPARSLAEVRLGHERNRMRRLRDERSDLPAAFVGIVERALSRDPSRRFQSAGELELALTGFLATSADSTSGASMAGLPAASSAQAVAAPPVAETWRRRLARRLPLVAVLAAGLAAGVVAARAWLPAASPAQPEFRFLMTPPGTEEFLSFSLSPDGSHVAFSAEGRLWTRPIGSVEARPFPDSLGAHDPFWSPDNRSVAYFKQNALWVASLGGGESRYLSPAWNAQGGSWGADGTILFGADFGRAIYRIPSAGGERVVVRSQGEHGTDLRWPSFVPGTPAFIYSSRRAPDQPRLIMAGRLDGTAADHPLLESDANAQIAGDRLLFVRNGRLFAQPFDGRTLRLSGEPQAVANRIGSNLYNREGYANFSAATQQVALLAYLGARQIDRQLALVGRDGTTTTLLGPGEYRDLALSPDGAVLAYEQLDEVTGTRDIWTLDLARRATSRLTTDPADDLAPVWSPDGHWIYFATNRDGRAAVYRRAADGTGVDEVFMPDSGRAVPFHLSPAGLLAFTRPDQRRDSDIWLVPIGAPAEQKTFRASTWRENEPRFSPDGHWLAYSTTDNGDRHVYIERVDRPGPRWQFSVRNGREPFWRADGKELYYHGPDRMLMAVSVDLTGGTPILGPPRPVVQLQFRGWDVRHHVAPLPDGSAFVMNVPVAGSSPPPLTFLLNWGQ
jgi:dipeptidyl aminopeptidase/acylaminoacyl peptidase